MLAILTVLSLIKKQRKTVTLFENYLSSQTPRFKNHYKLDKLNLFTIYNNSSKSFFKKNNL